METALSADFLAFNRSMAIRGPTARETIVACVAAAVLQAAAVARAQTPAPKASPTVSVDTREKEIELRGIEDTLKASEEQRRKIEADVEAIKLDRVRLDAALIETTEKVQDTERRRAEANARLDGLAAQALALNHSLEERRDSIADILAALERMGANPPPAILVKPTDMAAAVRAAIVIGSMVPQMHEEAQALAADLTNMENLKAAIAKERDGLAESARALVLDKLKLTDLISARQQSLAEAEGALQLEGQRAADLAGQASNLKELILRLEDHAPGAKPGDLTGAKPAPPFADAKGTLNLPVAGAILKTFGAADEFGGVEKGVSIATPANATVSAPISGRIVYAGPYRTYGQLLILNAGDGYYMVLAGMDRISVSQGQFVLAGEAIAAMGDGSSRLATAAAIGATQPVLYIELRKNDTAIDPGPWWSKNGIEKAHG